MALESFILRSVWIDTSEYGGQDWNWTLHSKLPQLNLLQGHDARHEVEWLQVMQDAVVSEAT